MRTLLRKTWLFAFLLVTVTSNSGVTQDWPLWKSYVAGFMDNQVRVIDHSAGDRTTSEGQAYGMFFALVANDRARFDGLLHWTEANLAGGDLAAHLPAWLWGQGKDKQWGVLDSNSASDADLWMAYSLLEAGKAWGETRYTTLGAALAKRIASEETAEISGFGTILLPGPKGFQHGGTCRLNASYLPPQLLAALGHDFPEGPWQQIEAKLPALLAGTAPHGFVSDWGELHDDRVITASAVGSYDAIRVYLWMGMLDADDPQRNVMFKSVAGMPQYLRSNAVPPEKVRPDGTIESRRGPVGFSAAVMPLLSALGEKDLENQQSSRLRSEFDSKTGLYGYPAKYYDQNLILFALGFTERRFWFNSQGALQLTWKQR